MLSGNCIKYFIPFLHIAEATGLEIMNRNIKRVALLGTKFTMEKDLYKAYLKSNFGIEVIIPSPEEREHIHRIIYTELVHGLFKKDSRATYQQIIGNLERSSAEGVILGCT